MSFWSWRPALDSLSELQRQFDRLVDFTIDASRQMGQGWRQFPAFNLYETAREYVLVAPLPGVKPEDLEVTVIGSTVTLKGERKRSAAPDEAYRRQERRHGKWSRSLHAPERADLSRIEASLQDGLLTLTIPKLPETQPRQVPVRVQAGVPSNAQSVAYSVGQPLAQPLAQPEPA